jgi:DNA (cytosine-5)-methyltransferase 1
MTHLGLFEGIGGFSLAARWMGWETVAWCEWNDFSQKILKYHFPEAEGFGDITKTDFKKYANRIDILTGGFPCQPYSLAGKRKGKEDERHLWPQMLRAIREIRPTYVVGENVYGLINWSGGLVFDEVQADLEAEGYEVWAYVLPACSVDAPHKRERVWFVAYSHSCGNDRKQGSENSYNESQKSKDYDKIGNRGPGKIKRYGEARITPDTNSAPTKNTIPTGRNLPPGIFYKNVTNPDSNGQHRSNGKNEIQPNKKRFDAFGNVMPMGDLVTDTNSRGQSGKEYGETKSGWITEKGVPRNWQNFPAESPICGGNDGLPAKLDGITFPKWRNESIKAYGNAIVPQVAYQIFKAIEQIKTVQ